MTFIIERNPVAHVDRVGDPIRQGDTGFAVATNQTGVRRPSQQFDLYAAAAPAPLMLSCVMTVKPVCTFWGGKLGLEFEAVVAVQATVAVAVAAPLHHVGDEAIPGGDLVAVGAGEVGVAGQQFRRLGMNRTVHTLAGGGQVALSAVDHGVALLFSMPGGADVVGPTGQPAARHLPGAAP
jgi:hypothetical protein